MTLMIASLAIFIAGSINPETITWDCFLFQTLNNHFQKIPKVRYLVQKYKNTESISFIDIKFALHLFHPYQIIFP